MSKGGGGACECPRVGVFFKLMTSRGQCPRGGGAPGVPPIQVQTPPTWLAGYGPGLIRVTSLLTIGSVRDRDRYILLLDQVHTFTKDSILPFFRP